MLCSLEVKCLAPVMWVFCCCYCFACLIIFSFFIKYFVQVACSLLLQKKKAFMLFALLFYRLRKISILYYLFFFFFLCVCLLMRSDTDLFKPQTINREGESYMMYLIHLAPWNPSSPGVHSKLWSMPPCTVPTYPLVYCDCQSRCQGET